MSNAIFERVTRQLVEHLERGTAPWRRTWKDGGRPMFGAQANAVSGRAYRGLNVLILAIAKAERGYSSDAWLTPKQAIEAGLEFKGERCTQVTFWKQTTRTVRDELTGEDAEQRGLLCRVYNVLNADQCKGDKSKLRGVVTAPAQPMKRHALADAIARGLSLEIRHGGDRAFYVPSADYIAMPALEQFESEGAYCATLTHEAVHATGHKSRLDRAFGDRFGDHRYAMEELVAELGAAFVGAVTGHSSEVPNHASYLAGWLESLKADSRAI